MSSGPYSDNLVHLFHELQRIDLLIKRAVLRLRALQSQGPDELRGLYISDAEVDAILAGKQAVVPGFQAAGSSDVDSPQLAETAAHLAQEIGQRVAQSRLAEADLRLPRLAERLNLTRFEIDAMLICLAPELDLKYERLFAYLQDDVTRKRPTVDLVLNLLCSSLPEKLLARRHFAPHAVPFKHQLLELFNDPSQPQPPLLAQYLKLDERIVSYLLGADDLDVRLAPFARQVSPMARLDDLLLPDDVKQSLRLLARRFMADGAGTIFYFQGPYGVGKQTTAEALCCELGMELTVVDGDGLLTAASVRFDTGVSLAAREALLRAGALYWDGFDALLTEERRAEREALVRALEARRGLTFLGGNTVWQPADTLHRVPFIGVEFPRPGYAERMHMWSTSLNGQASSRSDLDLGGLASKFRFSGGQIRDAVATAHNLARRRDPEHEHVTMSDLYAASRLQSNRNLLTLARKIVPHYSWNDIVLSPDRLQQLREICNYVKYRSVVYDVWGFDAKLALGKGLNALFAGPSGTGKTMAAEIMAGELALDLYKIDLSSVVSKYIGETEKNLSRIFDEAETSNAILFFDEADALFGKRSEVRDSHDRYANIEIGYLLQKMEEYEGVVILATNLRKNMDDAFVRRMHFAVEFPFPGEKERRRIWEQIWPDGTPRSPELDLDFLARQLDLAGGNIRNIALAAAFLAAADGAPVSMGHLVRATRREYQKMGKVVAAGEFGHYASLVEQR